MQAHILQKIAREKGLQQSQETVEKIEQENQYIAQGSSLIENPREEELKQQEIQSNDQFKAPSFLNPQNNQYPDFEIMRQCDLCKQDFPSSIILEHQNLCFNQDQLMPGPNHNFNQQNNYFEEAKVSQNENILSNQRTEMFGQNSFGDKFKDPMLNKIGSQFIGSNQQNKIGNQINQLNSLLQGCQVNQNQSETYGQDTRQIKDQVQCDNCGKYFDQKEIADHVYAHILQLENQLPQGFNQQQVQNNQNTNQGGLSRNQRRRLNRRNRRAQQNQQQQAQGNQGQNNRRANRRRNKKNKNEVESSDSSDISGMSSDSSDSEDLGLDSDDDGIDSGVDIEQDSDDDINLDDSDDLMDAEEIEHAKQRATVLKDQLPTIVFKKENFKNCEQNSDKLECRICMAFFEDNQQLRMLQCMHHYHQECIDKWFEQSNKCPLCNTKQKVNQN